MYNFFFIQNRDFYNLGRYTGMSIMQGGNGFPFFATPVYDYYCYGKSTGFSVSNKELPDSTLAYIVEKE